MHYYLVYTDKNSIQCIEYVGDYSGADKPIEMAKKMDCQAFVIHGNMLYDHRPEECHIERSGYHPSFW